jgi:opacity protein-like surface antigen
MVSSATYGTAEGAMKYLVLGAGVALACGLVAGASAAEKKGAAHATGEHHMSLTGCLQKGSEPNTFKLTDVSGEHAKGVKEWELVGAPADLKLGDHVGHKVEVTGSTVGPRTAEKLEGVQKPSKKELAEESKEHHLKVTGLKHVSPTCP